MRNELVAYTAKEADVVNKVFTDTEKEDIRNAVIARLPYIEVDNALIELTEKMGEKERKSNTTNFNTLYREMVLSLERQISDLGRRANTNLFMGSVTTLVGLVFLGYFVVDVTTSLSADRTATAITFGTRLSLVIFIEVFAYFFLRLYRSSIFEIKYFQNEITNVRSKIIAIELCYRDKRFEVLDQICLDLAKTERNFILRKGETTLSLKQEADEKQSDIMITKLVKHLTRMIKEEKDKDL